VIAAGDVTLGVLAGGRASRFGGRDKAWLLDRGVPMLAGCLAMFPDPFAARLVAARAPDPRHAALGVVAVVDRREGFRGPVAALEALAQACTTRWLLTVPVDARDVPPALFARLAAAGDRGAAIVDADGLQPLLALWPARPLAAAATAALDAGDTAARDLVVALALASVPIAPLRLRNLNAPDCLQAAS
jgi:molybdenum cofactor guanylyltransferase